MTCVSKSIAPKAGVIVRSSKSKKDREAVVIGKIPIWFGVSFRAGRHFDLYLCELEKVGDTSRTWEKEVAHDGVPRSNAKQLSGAMRSLRQLRRDRIDKERAFSDEAKMGCGFFDEVTNGGEACIRGKECKGKALGGAELEGDAFQAPRFVVENLNIVLGVADRGNSLEVGGGVADVLGSGALDGGDSGGAKAEVIVSDPIAFVVAGAFSCEGVVGGLVMFVACGGENFFTKREHFGVEIRVV